jgi:DNA repair exonuclease SbcCD ATPase subunit
MKNLKLIYLNIDSMHIEFQDGINYIIGQNASGKSTIFNCIKYANK